MSAAQRVKVMLVTKRPGNLRVMQQTLEADGIESQGALDEAALERVLASDFVPDLALIDVSEFGASAWRMCSTLQARSLPFIVIFQPNELQVGSESLKYKPFSLLQKPIAKSALLKLIENFTS